MSSNPKKGKRTSRERGREKSLTPGQAPPPKKSVFDSLYNIAVLSDPDDDNLESDSKHKRASDASRKSTSSRKERNADGKEKVEAEADEGGFYSLKSKSTEVQEPKDDGRKSKFRKSMAPGPRSSPTQIQDGEESKEDNGTRTTKAKPKKSEAQKADEDRRFLATLAAADAEDDDDDMNFGMIGEVEQAIQEAEVEKEENPLDEAEIRKLDKFIEFPAESVKQKLHRAKKVHEGKLDAAYGPLEIMNYQKKAIIKAAVVRARRHERVNQKLARHWDSSSESEECVDCYTPKSIRKEHFKAHASYHHGIKRTSLFATLVKWAVVLIGLFDYFITFYLLLRVYTYQMWLTYFRAKQWLNCVESIVSAYQFEVFFYCVNMVNSVNLIFSLRRSKWKFLSYWLWTQLILCIVAPIPAFAGARFNAKNGNVASIIRAQGIFHCLIVIKVGIVLYRLYMVRKPFQWRRLSWFIKAERDRQLNQDLDARNSSFIQKKNSYRNAFNTALYSVIKTLVDHFETHGKPLNPVEVGEIIKKYDETLNDITMYPGIEQYLRMAYIRFCVKHGMKDKRILARQTQFFKLRDERMQRIAMEAIAEKKRKDRIHDMASVGGDIEILPN